MGGRVGRRPIPGDSKGRDSLPEEDIRAILRGAAELGNAGGRSLLAKMLKGSRAVLEHDLQYSSAFGAFRDLPIETITARIDWAMEHGYLDFDEDER